MKVLVLVMGWIVVVRVLSFAHGVLESVCGILYVFA